MRIILAFTSVLIILWVSLRFGVIGNSNQSNEFGMLELNAFESFNIVLLKNNEVPYLIGYTESGQNRIIGLMEDIFPTYSKSEGFDILIRHIKENGIMTFSGERAQGDINALEASRFETLTGFWVIKRALTP